MDTFLLFSTAQPPHNQGAQITVSHLTERTPSTPVEPAVQV